MEAVPAAFVSLYPPDDWIPASAGMTREGPRDSSLCRAFGERGLKEVQENLLPGV
jgi:hypothetical protein